MSTAALVGALISGLVLLGVATLIVLAWIDDRRRQDEEAFANSRAARGRETEPPTAPAPQPEPDDTPAVLVLPPEAAPAPTIDLTAAEPEPTTVETAAGAPARDETPPAQGPEKPKPPEPGGSWQIHTLKNGEGA